MPVKNALPYLDDAIASVLRQTREDFEFIIGDDASTDGSSERLAVWAQRDARIKLMRRAVSDGPVGSSNWVAFAATCSIVARMDADDICHPDRFRREIEVLEAHSDAVMVGSTFKGIDEKGRFTRPSIVGPYPHEAGGPMPIAHGSIMYRREAFERVGGYAAGTDYFEDCDLYSRISAIGSILVIVDPLYEYRFSRSSGRLNVDVATLRRAMRTKSHIVSSTASVDRSNHRNALRTIGMIRLWAGHRPGILQALFRDGAIDWTLSSARLMPLALAGEMFPGAVRALARLKLRLGNYLRRRSHHACEIFEWQPSYVSYTMLPPRP
jgi:glycosyltransferase involved in cell wall biosynthesis